MGTPASKEARLSHPLPLALRKAELLVENFVPPAWGRHAKVQTPKLLEFLIFGSAARGTPEVHDVDCAVLFQARQDLEEEQISTLRQLEFAERLTHNRNKAYAEVPTDLIPIPDTYFKNQLVRNYVNGMFVNPDFVFNALNGCLRFDRVSGRFLKTDWAYFVGEYSERRDSH